MASRVRQLVAPAYLLLCLVLGGSAQAVLGNAALQLIGLAIIAWAALERPANAPSRPAVQLHWLVGLTILYVTFQLVPLPPALWSTLGPRALIAGAYRDMGLALPWLPLSVAPYDSFATLLTLIPPIALYCAVERLHAYRAAFLVAALVAGTILGIMLGVLQVASPGGTQSPFYLFSDVNVGAATGFFANANHMASLLLATLPFLAAVARGARQSGKQRAASVTIGAAALALVVIVGVVLNGSLAAFLLLAPVLGASALILVPASGQVRRVAIILAALLMAGAVFALNLTAIGGQAVGAGARDSVLSRPAIFATTARAARDYMPFGSGLGTYRPVYDSYENPDQVTTTYSSHAHNDYAEITLELGLFGIFIMLLFFYWWARAAVDAWRSPEPQPYVRAAVIASAAILAHSLVDYPLRTAAISSLFAMCLAFLADRVKSDPLESKELRPTRHLSLD